MPTIFMGDKLPGLAKMILVYSPTGVGKTTSTLQTLPEPPDGKVILFLAMESLTNYNAVEASGIDKKKLRVVFFDDFADLIQYVAEDDNFKDVDSILLDNITYLMAISLSNELEDEQWDKRSATEKKSKPLASQAKMSQESYGALASQMGRLMNLLSRQLINGITVVVTSLLQSNPTWDRTLQAAPALTGKKFSDNLPSFFELIGLLANRYKLKKDDKGRIVKNKDGDEVFEIVYPPEIYFRDDGQLTGSFFGKYQGTSGKASGVYNIEKILKHM